MGVFKYKVIGIILIVLGALPFLMEISSFYDFFASNSALFAITPGGWSYQIILIVLGVLLVWDMKRTY